jgi:hypothetical protein
MYDILNRDIRQFVVTPEVQIKIKDLKANKSMEMRIVFFMISISKFIIN